MDKEKEAKILGELGYDIRVKPVTTPPKTPDIPQGRDTFETPNYATDLLIPFIPKQVKYIWECAAGSGKIAGRLRKAGYKVVTTDIRELDGKNLEYNFLDANPFTGVLPSSTDTAIVTNPPFSIKKEFIERAFSYKVPFAFLINADYSGQSIGWVERGCEKIIPNRRIAYITPNICQRVHEGEIFKLVKNDFPKELKINNFKDIAKRIDAETSNALLDFYKNYHNYATHYDIPQELLHKYSSAQFHSMWIAYGFGLGKSETFVDLPIRELKNNI